MATIDWPSAWIPRQFTVGAVAPKSAFVGHFTGAPQTIGHLADRLRITLRLPKCDGATAAAREAMVLHLASSGDWVRLWHLLRPAPLGTLRGTPSVAISPAAGARSVEINTAPDATLLPGDPLGLGGRLCITGPAGAVANGAGRMMVPLALPLLASVGSGTAVAWSAPADTFALIADEPGVTYGRGGWQDELDLAFRQVP